MSTDSALDINGLPSDIMRMIIKMGLEDSFESMRLVSPQWNDAALDYLRDHKRLPPITALRLHFYSGGKTITKFNIKILMKYHNYFGVLSCFPMHARWLPTSPFFNNLINNVPNYQNIRFEQICGRHMNANWFSNRAAKLFDRCSRICKLDLEVVNFEQKEFQVVNIKNILGDVTIQELYLNQFSDFNQRCVSNIYNLVRSLSVERIVLTFRLFHRPAVAHFRTYFDTIVTMISQSVNLVDSIVLTAVEYANANWNDNTERENLAKFADDLSDKAIAEVAFAIEEEPLTDRYLFGGREMRFTINCSRSLMSSDNDLLNIDNLPSDVIRNIIRVGQESIEELRMISRRWNDLTLDHFTYRKHLPPLTSINWRFEPCGEEYFTFSMEISNNLLNYFEVPKQLITDYETESVFVGVDRKYRKVKKQEWFSRRLGRLISRCSHIQKLEMDAMNFDKKEFQFDHIRSVLGDVTVHQLICNTFHNMSHATVGNFTANILNLIRALSVRRLVLPLAAFHRQPTVIAHSYFIFICKTVSKAANLVDSIDIIAEDWFNDGDEPTVKEHWTTIAGALSKQANVEVTFVMKKEQLLHVDALKMYITVTARKPIDE